MKYKQKQRKAKKREQKVRAKLSRRKKAKFFADKEKRERWMIDREFEKERNKMLRTTVRKPKEISENTEE
ncbi:hypothetical protein N8257_00435 [Ulvibacter sp.]|nr:hypothetical protein [Ulvibacter sp.]